jgi:hypothetical protein
LRLLNLSHYIFLFIYYLFIFPHTLFPCIIPYLLILLYFLIFTFSFFSPLSLLLYFILPSFQSFLLPNLFFSLLLCR